MCRKCLHFTLNLLSKKLSVKHFKFLISGKLLWLFVLYHSSEFRSILNNAGSSGNVKHFFHFFINHTKHVEAFTLFDKEAFEPLRSSFYAFD